MTVKDCYYYIHLAAKLQLSLVELSTKREGTSSRRSIAIEKMLSGLIAYCTYMQNHSLSKDAEIC